MLFEATTRALAAALTAASASAGSVGRNASDTVVEIPPPFSTAELSKWSRLVELWLKYGAAGLESQIGRGCPACGAAEARPIFVSHDGYPFSECERCGCWYVPRHIDRGLYEHFFERSPEARQLAEEGFAKRQSEENLAMDLRRIGAYLDLLVRDLPGASPRYLDIGAGTGSSLVAAGARGLRAIGVETAAGALAAAQRRGVDIRDGALGLPGGPFDLISLWETLEHLDDPSGVLAESACRLAPAGLLAITVPNLDSPLTRIMRGDCPFIGGGADGPGHINLFGVHQLDKLLSRSGLSIMFGDGQYSTNLLEVAGFLLGKHRGAADLLSGAPLCFGLPSGVASILNSVGPAAALMERVALLSPIIMVVACRTSDRTAMDRVSERLAESREQEVLEQAERLRQGVPDYPSLAERLKREVNIRDGLLSKMQEEVKARDDALRELSDELRLLINEQSLASMMRKVRSRLGGES